MMKLFKSVLMLGAPALMATVLAGCSPVGIVAGVGAGAGLAIAQERSVRDAVVDTQISLQIGEALFRTHVDDLFRPVSVDVFEGRVLLSGVVRSRALSDQAGQIAWGANGVRRVYNEIQIGDDSLVDPIRDRWITAQLLQRLLADELVRNINYAVTTAASVVHVSGVAQDQAELDRVLGHAREIEHVRRVVNRVVLKDDPIRSTPP